MNSLHRESARRPSFPALVVFLFLSLSVLLVIADRAPLHLDKRNPIPPVSSDFYRQYYGVLDGSSGGPYVYRVLLPWVTAWTHRLLPSADVIDIDAALKLLLLFLVQMSFFRLLQRFFDPWLAFAGVLWMDALLGYSLAYVLGPASGESTDILNLLVFILALDLMPDPGTPALMGVFVIGMLNRETPLLLLPLVFAVDRSEGRGTRRPVIVSIATIAVYTGLRIAIHTTSGAWFTTEGLRFNLPGYESGMAGKAFQSILHVAVLLAPMFAIAAAGFRGMPLLFRGCIILAGVLVIIHFAVATVIESRLWMPMFALLIPPSLYSLKGIFDRPGDPDSVDSRVNR